LHLRQFCLGTLICCFTFMGTSMLRVKAARTPMIAMTTNTSMSVKACRVRGKCGWFEPGVVENKRAAFVVMPFQYAG